MASFTNGQIIIDPIYCQISYKCCHWNSLKLKLGHNPKIFLVEMKIAQAKEIANHVLRPVKVIADSCIKARCAHLLIIIHRLWKVVKRVKEVDGGQENDTWINVSSDWNNRIDCIASIYIRSNGCLSVPYLSLRQISQVPENEPICPAYIRATERYH